MIDSKWLRTVRVQQRRRHGIRFRIAGLLRLRWHHEPSFRQMLVGFWQRQWQNESELCKKGSILAESFEASTEMPLSVAQSLCQECGTLCTASGRSSPYRRLSSFFYVDGAWPKWSRTNLRGNRKLIPRHGKSNPTTAVSGQNPTELLLRFGFSVIKPSNSSFWAEPDRVTSARRVLCPIRNALHKCLFML